MAEINYYIVPLMIITIYELPDLINSNVKYELLVTESYYLHLREDDVKYLGIYLDIKLNWQIHMKKRQQLEMKTIKLY